MNEGSQQDTRTRAALNEFQQALTEIGQWHETHDARVDEMPPELVSRLRRATCEAHAYRGEVPLVFEARLPGRDS